MSDETISALISENARLVAELRRAEDTIRRLNGEYDAKIRCDDRQKIINRLERMKAEYDKKCNEDIGYAKRERLSDIAFGISRAIAAIKEG